ncbi:MAG TPA: UDP-N-acetylmuramoyl-L-alanyl-D-glutamate--2,6-diaminopimelate ligase [Haloplasmataceae bacterium]
MLSKDILKGVEIIFKSSNYHDDIEIDYLSENTNDIKPNTCLICIKGTKHDAHELLSTLKTNPVLIIASKQIITDIPYIIVADTLQYLPLICRNFFSDPSKKLSLIGVTGTDGKTTTALIIKQLLDEKCAYIGTNGYMIHKQHHKTSLTTPKPIMLNSYLDEAVKNNIDYVSLEVSSQGIEYHRLDYLQFKAAIFTNISHEHLDYHKTIENYFYAKLKLFKMLDKNSLAIVNLDCKPYAEEIIKNTKAKVITYGKDIHSDFQITNIKLSLQHTTFDLITSKEIYPNISLNLFGEYNVYNATAALAVLNALGYNLQEIIPKLQYLNEIEGRMHFVNCGQPFDVIVDFAHTPNALENLLSNIRKVFTNNIIIVFGAAGERDKTKRPLMGEVADKYANTIILTSEDPKSEATLDIINDIAKGINNIFKVIIIPNRKKAIIKAIDLAQKDDVVIITGKGNEEYEIFNGYIVQHNDITTVEDHLQNNYSSLLLTNFSEV